MERLGEASADYDSTEGPAAPENPRHGSSPSPSLALDVIEGANIDGGATEASDSRSQGWTKSDGPDHLGPCRTSP